MRNLYLPKQRLISLMAHQNTGPLLEDTQMWRFFLPFMMVATLANAEMQVPQTRGQIAMGFTPVVKQAAPAVVNIYAKRVVQERVSPFRGDPFFERLFDEGRSRPRVQNSLGSGVILSEDGIIVSNYHVVGQATDIRVVLKDRREFRADILLSDKESDLAILQLRDAPLMPYLPMRDSAGIEVGELVLAIGNPFGVGQTVSSGIVSGLARSGVATGNARGYFIQTDAPINPGNSGGALVDINGDLVGVNTSILTKSGGSNGIGFAIPASLVAQFVAQARAGHTTFQRPWAGLSGQSVDGDIAAGLGLDRPTGVLISDVHPQSPFYAAGMEPGDLITHVNGAEVNAGSEVLYHMSVAGIGAEVEITRLRKGREERLQLTMMAAPETPPRAPYTTSRDHAIPGVTFLTINPAVQAEFGLSNTAKGALVADIGRFGGRVGLRRGDVLLAVNGDLVHTSAEAATAFAAPVRRFRLDVVRGGQRATLWFQR